MTAPLIYCPKCKAALISGVFNRQGFVPCPACATPLEIEVFPAMFRPRAEGQTAEAVMMEGEASCFYHPQKKAVLPCESCGRFLCTLCDCEHQGHHFCPGCLTSGQKKGKIKSLDNSRVRYDRIALGLTLWPFALTFVGCGFYLTPFTAPAAIIVSLKYWKSPFGLTQKSRAQFVWAILIALLQLAGITLFVIAIVTSN
jgi:hypothetical protein